MDLKKLKLYYCISFLGYLGSGVLFSFLMVFILLTSENDTIPDIISFIIAAAFWLFVILGSVFVIMASFKERQIYQQIKLGKNTDKYKRQVIIGLVSFFKNKKSAFADIIFIVTVILTVILYLMHINIPWLIITLTTLVMTSFVFHSFWNGKIYNCISYLKNESKNEE